MAIFGDILRPFFSEPRAAGFRPASLIHTKATPCVEVWQASNLRRLRLGEEKKKEQTTVWKYIWSALFHRATINYQYWRLHYTAVGQAELFRFWEIHRNTTTPFGIYYVHMNWESVSVAWNGSIRKTLSACWIESVKTLQFFRLFLARSFLRHLLEKISFPITFGCKH